METEREIRREREIYIKIDREGKNRRMTGTDGKRERDMWRIKRNGIQLGAVCKGRGRDKGIERDGEER